MENINDQPLHFGLELLIKDRESLINFLQGLVIQKKPHEVMELLSVLDCKSWLGKCKGFNKLYHCVAACGCIGVIKLLVSTFPNEIDVKNSVGSTLLYTSIENRQDIITAFLIEAGANVMVINDHGNSLLHLLVQRPGEFYIELMREIILNNRTLVNHQNCFGETALHLACLVGNLKAIELLLKNGAFVLEETKTGKLPSNYAIESQYCEEINEMLNKYENDSNKQIKSPDVIQEIKSMSSKDVSSDHSKKTQLTFKNMLIQPLKLVGSAAKSTVNKVLIEDKMITVLKLIKQQQELFKDNEIELMEQSIRSNSVDFSETESLMSDDQSYRVLVLDSPNDCSILDQLLVLEQIIENFPLLLYGCDVICTYGFSCFNACCLLNNQLKLLKNILPTLIEYTNDSGKLKYFQTFAMKLFGGDTVHNYHDKLQLFYIDNNQTIQHSKSKDVVKDLCFQTCSSIFSSKTSSILSTLSNPTLLAIKHANSIGIKTSDIVVLSVGCEKESELTLEDLHQEEKYKKYLASLFNFSKKRETEEECKVILQDRYHKINIQSSEEMNEIRSTTTKQWMKKYWK